MMDFMFKFYFLKFIINYLKMTIQEFNDKTINLNIYYKYLNKSKIIIIIIKNKI